MSPEEKVVEKARRLSVQAKRWVDYPDEYGIHKARKRVVTAKWTANNPEAARALRHVRRARKKGAEGRFYAADIALIRVLQKDKCAFCSSRLKGFGHRDHIVPLSFGGSNWPSNIQLLCQGCNLSKGAKHPIVFARERGMLL